MTDHELDTFDHDSETRRLFQDFERMITAFNTANISAVTGDVSVRQFLEVARVVSLLRARYLKRVLRLADVDTLADLDRNEVTQLRHERETYEEALEGFGALRHALMRQYFTLSEDGEEINLAS